MPFRPLSPRSVRWRPVGGEGLEQCHVAPDRSGIRVSSVVVGERDGSRYGVFYEIDCDAGWRVRAFRLRVAGGPSLDLLSTEEGRWFDRTGAERRDLAGCIDVDLAGTPFTNTLPIRRLDLSPGSGAVELSMLYVPFDTFEPCRDEQRYTLDTGRYLYEASDGSFSARLSVDEDGLVTDYPTLFERA